MCSAKFYVLLCNLVVVLWSLTSATVTNESNLIQRIRVHTRPDSTNTQPQEESNAQGEVSPASQSPPESWRDLTSNVHSVTDFLSLLVKEDGSPVREDELFSPETQDGKRVITSGGVMAVPDECSPRNVSIRLPLNYTTPNVAYWPECTMVQRCGGCTQPNLSCEPLYKENIVLKVMRAEYAHPGAMNLQWKGFQSVEVERHMTCRATCMLNADICGPLKTFQNYQCKCTCKAFTRCNPGQRWDDNTCSCVCPNVQPCCPGQDAATCHTRFDGATCSCVLKEFISGGQTNNITLDQFSRYRESQASTGGHQTFEEWQQQQQQQGLEPASAAAADTTAATAPVAATTTTTTTPAPTTTTTTTTTTPAPEAPGGCQRSCPSGFQATFREGRGCVCVFVGRPRG